MTNTNGRAKVPQAVIDAVQRYGDARADDSPTFDAMGKVIETIRAAISSAVPDGGKGEAVAMRVRFGAREPEIISWNVLPDGEHNLYIAPQAECAPHADFQEGQWWVQELDSATSNGSDEFKRAVAVVHHLLRVTAAPPAECAPLCEHEWEAMTKPHKECVKCGDVRLAECAPRALTDEEIEAEATLYSLDLSNGIDWCFDDFNLKAFAHAIELAVKEQK